MPTQVESDVQTSEDAFRTEVRQFLATNFPDELKGTGNMMAGLDGPTDENPVQKKWREAVGGRGWGTPTWPKEYGGGGLTKGQARIIEHEFAKVGAYNPIGGMGVMMFGPTLLEYGDERQKLEHIPPICRGEIRWCQGYSEPNAGSDLANLQTFAVDKGDHYLINGQKTWTSGGQWADKCFAIVRTDRSDKHKGISFMLIDMDAPGVEVRPITMISGTSPFCETFFTDVKVPKENLVGKEGQGWTIGKRLLQHERTNISGGGRLAGMMGQSLGDIAKKYCETGGDGALVNKVLRDKIADLEIRWNSFLLTARRAVEESKAQGGVSEISSVLKKVGTKLAQDRSELLIEIRGFQGLGWEGDEFGDDELEDVRGWLFGKAATIYGGSTEVQNNIIAKRVLGMLDHQ
ncbi:MAG: acyl-CoA dehydrogenase family protein [Alphaproteobacteria bacterium]|jgi:alkylation response protein AidB-like acyl-CoA dehydrogenase|uniref:acyl-CoA dehydrogenase family protein n=1 Tax=Hyphomonas sp. TaxID=87 RepID=UPI001B15B03C|nr:acyl-CoA dehydrogenase family protein [Hyphomonas sp.]MBO6582526.1 acyl-CoA dehydrogenase family protein [Hyphomonas sp.]MBU2083054.1 acyl-CoA dehydrogenase family protein [Alphaproteobacteria bacterium]MBU2144647.1 acyl-CoA dehydrogenase family protein [Alphaproteobacteria bacterium]MBU2195338.1 acyl-CoA dehydrogenase family protein [Alphaproteobacteria bacterium]